MRSGLTARAGDPYLRWDAAYVLGALPPRERREYENHLAGCAECTTDVLELAGIPGLLARARTTPSSTGPDAGLGHPCW